VNRWRKHHACGDVIIVRYADDFVMGFQHQHEARQFQTELKARLEQFGLSLHPEKTRLIEFGRFAASNRRGRGECKPQTFDFLGFTHVCARGRQGRFCLRRKTASKRLRARLKLIGKALKSMLHRSIAEQGRWLARVVRGYLQYHAVPGNMRTLNGFCHQVKRHWLQTLRRRSQRHRMPWERFARLVAHWIPTPRILHPYPSERFYAAHPR
jgi:RNA-directed DNA polymerase